MKRLLALFIFLISAIPNSFAAQPVRVVATFSILGDIVQQVGGARVQVTTLVGAGGDAHSYQPSAQDAKALANAQIIVSNGLGFEPWIQKLISTSGTKAINLEASRGVVVRHLEEVETSHAHAHDKALPDPHAWNDVTNGIQYVANIRDALIKADPEGKAEYQTRAATYTVQLESINVDAKAKFATLPTSRKTIVMSHDSMGYFAAAYGLKVYTAQGLSTDSEPTAQDMAKLISIIKRQKISAVFLDSVTNPKILEQIAQESGAKIGGKLHTDALTDQNGVADTYLQLFNSNVATVLQVLQ